VIVVLTTVTSMRKPTSGTLPTLVVIVIIKTDDMKDVAPLRVENMNNNKLRNLAIEYGEAEEAARRLATRAIGMRNYQGAKQYLTRAVKYRVLRLKAHRVWEKREAMFEVTTSIEG